MKQTCPCCGYKTLTEAHRWDICGICFWEDDPTQFANPESTDGPNDDISLIEAQKNFMFYGASDKRLLELVRKPNKEDIKDPDWKPFF